MSAAGRRSWWTSSGTHLTALAADNFFDAGLLLCSAAKMRMTMPGIDCSVPVQDMQGHRKHASVQAVRPGLTAVCPHAGSCIDGRLTSAWNWCSQIEKKPYYHIFKVAGAYTDSSRHKRLANHSAIAATECICRHQCTGNACQLFSNENPAQISSAC